MTKNTEKKYDICIIGAGASGLAAAITAFEVCPGIRIAILEKNSKTGRKLRATGNGKCNITNTEAEDVEEVLSFLDKEGILLRIQENGLVYPNSESAQDVADQLTSRVKTCGGEFFFNLEVAELCRCSNGWFKIRSEGKESKKIYAKKVLIATGGKSAPVYGTTGDGYKLAEKLGHKVARLVPVLTAVECAQDKPQSVAGVRAHGTATLYRHRKQIFREKGEIQFTKTGLSGICIFNMTRFMRFEQGGSMDDFEIGIDFLPNMGKAYLESFFDRKRRLSGNESAETLLRTVVKKQLCEYILKRTGIARTIPLQMLKERDLKALEESIKDLRFHPTGLRGWKEAQCTSGGVLLTEIDKNTGESCRVPSLYFSGEVLDYDGPCGGFNLNNAWRTGIRAGRAMGSSTERERNR